MTPTQPRARDSAELQVGDTVRYETTFYTTTSTPTIEGIIVGIYRVRDSLRYFVFSRTPHGTHLPLIDHDQIVRRINSDYRGMTPDYILALHDAAHLKLNGS